MFPELAIVIVASVPPEYTLSSAGQPFPFTELSIRAACLYLQPSTARSRHGRSGLHDKGSQELTLIAVRCARHRKQHWQTRSTSWHAGKVEDRLRESAKLQYKAATVQQAASAAKVAARRTRAALATLDLAGAMRRSVQAAQQLRGAQGRPPVPLAPQ